MSDEFQIIPYQVRSAGTDVPPEEVQRGLNSLAFQTQVALNSLAGGGGTIPSGNVTYNEGGTGAVTRTATSKFQEVISVKDFGATGNGTTDDTVAIQNAINAATGAFLWFPAGKYKISAQLNILTPVRLFAPKGLVSILLSTQNQYGIVFGDGTDATRNNMFYAGMSGIEIVPFQGVLASTSGAPVKLNNVAYIDIIDPVFYGADTVGTKLFNGTECVAAAECNIIRPRYSFFAGQGVTTSGTDTGNHRTIDLRIENPLFTNITQDCVFFGAFTEGCTLINPVAYSYSAWFLHIQSDPSTQNGFNFFVLEPNIEVDTGSNGIWVEKGTGLYCKGGWIGAGAIGQTAIRLDNNGSGHHFTATEIEDLNVTCDAPAVTMTGCTHTGDGATQTIGIDVTANAVDFSAVGPRIRQFTQYGIRFNASALRGLVSAPIFDSIGTLEVTGATNANMVQVDGDQSDAPFNVTAAATLPLRYGRPFIQVSGATAITAMTVLSQGKRITIQAGSGGITFNSSGSLLLYGDVATLTVPQFTIVSFRTDGQTWFQDSPAGAVTGTGSTVLSTNPAISGATLTGGTINSTSVGATTPSTGAFTTLSSTGNFTPSQTNGIVGTTTNNNANAGSVGEFPTPTNLTGVSIASGATVNASSVSLTAGDWDVTGVVAFVAGAATVLTGIAAGISTTSATAGAAGTFVGLNLSFPAAATQNFSAPVVRISIATPTTVYLIANTAFASGSCTVSGFLRARRVR